jgi:hypothetical protein
MLIVLAFWWVSFFALLDEDAVSPDEVVLLIKLGGSVCIPSPCAGACSRDGLVFALHHFATPWQSTFVVDLHCRSSLSIFVVDLRCRSSLSIFVVDLRCRSLRLRLVGSCFAEPLSGGPQTR